MEAMTQRLRFRRRNSTQLSDEGSGKWFAFKLFLSVTHKNGIFRLHFFFALFPRLHIVSLPFHGASFFDWNDRSIVFLQNDVSVPGCLLSDSLCWTLSGCELAPGRGCDKILILLVPKLCLIKVLFELQAAHLKMVSVDGLC